MVKEFAKTHQKSSAVTDVRYGTLNVMDVQFQTCCVCCCADVHQTFASTDQRDPTAPQGAKQGSGCVLTHNKHTLCFFTDMHTES